MRFGISGWGKGGHKNDNAISYWQSLNLHTEYPQLLMSVGTVDIGKSYLLYEF